LIQQAAFGLEVKKRCLPIYEEIFDVEFPLPKLDTLVVRYPSHFLSLLINP
jgi:aminopeptidase 2